VRFDRSGFVAAFTINWDDKYVTITFHNLVNFVNSRAASPTRTKVAKPIFTLFAI
jgi:hypothetical protein